MSLKLRDVYEIRPQQSLVSLDDASKKQIVDHAMSSDEGNKRGLIITFDLSSSLRRTNNRLYTPAGQRNHVDSWTSPYPKPILTHHDTKSDPIGRIIEVNWVSNDDQCMRFFDNMQDFMKFKRVCDSDDPRKIYNAMHKNNLLTDDTWPGIGRLVAKARISDQAAIEKFLDGRYLTFSAGTHTDRYCCGICGSDWATGDVCEHSPGSISDEGMPGVFITGAFKGNEASVVTTPGNALSQLTSMEFGDSIDLKSTPESAFAIDSTDIQFTDAIVDTGDIMTVTNTDLQVAIDALKVMDPRDIARGIWDSTLTAHQTDALAARSHYETSWLIRIHDAMHSEYDWRLRWDDENSVEVPDAVFAFHGDLHELSADKDFRDSLINGPLDSFSKTGGTSEEYKSKRSSDSLIQGEVLTVITPTPAERMQELLGDEDALAALKAALQENADGVSTPETEAKETQEEGQEDQEGKEVMTDLSTLDWFLLNLAFTATIGDDKLDAEATEALDEGLFLGPERSFPIANAAHVVAARSVVEQIKASDEDRAALTAAIDRCEATICSPTCECGLADQLQALQNDYAASLELATQANKELKSLQEKLDVLDSADSSVHDKDKEVLNVDEINQVDDVSVSNAKALSGINKDLGDFEKKIVSRYKELRDSKGDAHANHYLKRKIMRGHLPRSFDIKPYIQENE